MKTFTKTKVAKFLEEKPLYSSMLLEEQELQNFNQFSNIRFNFYCKKDAKINTFKLKGDESQIGTLEALKKVPVSYEGEPFLVKRFKGECQYCNSYNVDIVLNIFTRKEKYYLRKIGQHPPFEIKPAKEIAKFLDEKDLEYYKKGLMNLSSNYGIGAFAYFRRVTENQIKNICKKLSYLDIGGSDKIKQAIKNYEKNHQMSALIDEVSKHTPDSLKESGDNLLLLLYKQLSGGIHLFTDEECFKKATAINILLKFIIRKLNEEEKERKDVLDAIKKLKE